MIDSTSTGDPGRHLTFADLEARMAVRPNPPADAGRVVLVVRRIAGGVRERPDRILFTRDGGVSGDAWARDDRDPCAQVAVMDAGVAAVIANGQPLDLFGDNLFVELDVSAGNLPSASRLRIGGAVLEVTPEPHTGCRKFQARFGPEALRYISQPALRDRHLRGIYMQVIDDGEVGPGDLVTVLSRA